VAQSDRGELDVRLGGQSRTLRFRTAECVLLEERLGKDVLAFLVDRGGATKFLVEAIFAGLSGQGDRKLTPGKVATWLDDFDDDVEDLQREILYAIARGKPAKEAKRLCEALDGAFGPREGSPADPLPEAARRPYNPPVVVSKPA
jgi:hypothetical protein